MRNGESAVNSGLGSTATFGTLLSHVSARAIEAVCLLIFNSLDLETLMQVHPVTLLGRHAQPFRSRANCDRMKQPWLFDLNNGGDGIAVSFVTTTCRLPLWFLAGPRSRG